MIFINLYRKVRYKISYWLKYIAFYIHNPFQKAHIYDRDYTVQYIIQHKCSVCRYGDGEFKIMQGVAGATFQKYSGSLQKRLVDIIKSNDKNIIVCIPLSYKRMDNLNLPAKEFFVDFVYENQKMILSFFDFKKKYYNSMFTRFYMDYVDKTEIPKYISKLKQIWRNRNLCIVEGSQSRLGIGNDLFDGAADVKRIICPSVNAFDKYDDIYQTVCSLVNGDTLILVALGMTATVLAYDLAKCGFQAIDIGHIDVEYEWFLMGAKHKVPIPHKYVNEVKDGRIKNDIMNDTKYQSEIISIISD